MSDSLRHSQIANEPRYTESVIRSSVQSSLGKSWMWVVVEDEDDIRVYKKFFLGNTRVLPSLAQDMSKGCKNVETIVANIKSFVTSKVAGVRDADYMRFEKPQHLLPGHVFVTDERDIEMQMLSSNAVQLGLSAWNNKIPTYLSWIFLNVAVERGCMRLLNEVCHLGCSFKEDAPISHLWDSVNRKMVDDWQNVMYKEFIANCKNITSSYYPFSRKKYAQLKRKKALNTQSQYILCQGHDVVRLLQYFLGDNKYNEKRIMAKMTEFYSINDFQKTKLYTELLNLQNVLACVFLK